MPGRCSMTKLYTGPLLTAFETGAHQATQADLELTLYPSQTLRTCISPASASQVAGMTGLDHQSHHPFFLFQV